MTFSLVARCEKTGQFGIAVSSSSPAVAARCAYTRAGVGAVATQNITDPTLGKKTLDLIEQGLSANEAIEALLKNMEHAQYRQVLAIDRLGNVGIHSGSNSLGIWTDARGKNVISAGNLLDNDQVPQAVVEGFTHSKGHLGDRLIAAMKAGRDQGGGSWPHSFSRHANLR